MGRVANGSAWELAVRYGKREWTRCEGARAPRGAREAGRQHDVPKRCSIGCSSSPLDDSGRDRESGGAQHPGGVGETDGMNEFSEVVKAGGETDRMDELSEVVE